MQKWDADTAEYHIMTSPYTKELQKKPLTHTINTGPDTTTVKGLVFFKEHEEHFAEGDVVELTCHCTKMDY